MDEIVRAIWRRIARRGERRTRELTEGLSREVREALRQLRETAEGRRSAAEPETEA